MCVCLISSADFVLYSTLCVGFFVYIFEMIHVFKYRLFVGFVPFVIFFSMSNYFISGLGQFLLFKTETLPVPHLTQWFFVSHLHYNANKFFSLDFYVPCVNSGFCFSVAYLTKRGWLCLFLYFSCCLNIFCFICICSFWFHLSDISIYLRNYSFVHFIYIYIYVWF